MGLKKNNPGCGCCADDCNICSGNTPLTISVTLSGFVNGSSCSDCNTIDGTWVCTQSATVPCRWDGGVLSYICVAADVAITVDFVTLDGGLTYKIECRVSTAQAPLGDTHTFRTATAVASWDCTATRSLPYVSQTGTSLCDASSATCQLN